MSAVAFGAILRPAGTRSAFRTRVLVMPVPLVLATSSAPPMYQAVQRSGLASE